MDGGEEREGEAESSSQEHHAGGGRDGDLSAAEHPESAEESGDSSGDVLSDGTE